MFGRLTPELLVAGLGLAILLPVVPFTLELLALRRLTTGAFGTLTSRQLTRLVVCSIRIHGRPRPSERIRSPAMAARIPARGSDGSGYESWLTTSSRAAHFQ